MGTGTRTGRGWVRYVVTDSYVVYLTVRCTVMYKYLTLGRSWVIQLVSVHKHIIQHVQCSYLTGYKRGQYVWWIRRAERGFRSFDLQAQRILSWVLIVTVHNYSTTFSIGSAGAYHWPPQDLNGDTNSGLGRRFAYFSLTRPKHRWYTRNTTCVRARA